MTIPTITKPFTTEAVIWRREAEDLSRALRQTFAAFVVMAVLAAGAGVAAWSYRSTAREALDLVQSYRDEMIARGIVARGLAHFGDEVFSCYTDDGLTVCWQRVRR